VSEFKGPIDGGKLRLRCLHKDRGFHKFCASSWNSKHPTKSIWRSSRMASGEPGAGNLHAGPQSNSSAFRALSANFKLKEVYLSRNCSSHVFAKRDGQASLESIWEIGSKKLSIFRAALESEPDYPRLTVDLSISGQGEIKSNPRSFCILGRVEAGSKMCLHIAHAGCRLPG